MFKKWYNTRKIHVRTMQRGYIIFESEILLLLKRFKDNDIKEVASGYECGIMD